MGLYTCPNSSNGISLHKILPQLKSKQRCSGPSPKLIESEST